MAFALLFPACHGAAGASASAPEAGDVSAATGADSAAAPDVAAGGDATAGLDVAGAPDAAPDVPPFAKDVADAPDALASKGLVLNLPDPAHVPALSGGTLAITADDAYVLAADSVRNAIFSVKMLNGAQEIHTIVLPLGAEPGRIAIGPDTRAYVALRASTDPTQAGVATIDYDTGKLLETRKVCQEPRGLAYDADAKMLWIACATGELVQLPDDAKEASATDFVVEDLRDLVLTSTGTEKTLFISRFRSAEVWKRSVKAGDKAVFASKPATVTGSSIGAGIAKGVMSPAVGWKMTGFGTGVMLAHQRGKDDPIDVNVSGSTGSPYSGVASNLSQAGIVASTVSIFDGNSAPSVAALPALCQTALPMDVAVSPDQTRFAIADAANPVVQLVSLKDLTQSGSKTCAPPIPLSGDIPVAVAFRSDGELVSLSINGVLRIWNTSGTQTVATIALPVQPLAAPAHQLFHTATKSGIACANCHPEGREDGRNWNFSSEGLRRTQPISGGLLTTLPLHWNGQFSTLDDLVFEVFTRRMGGDTLSADQVKSLGDWLNALPVPARPHTPLLMQAQAGQKLFESATVGCATCHSGSQLTDNLNHEVGTGAYLQTPSLVGVSTRLPVMHDGCAKVLKDRFGKCGGSKHGNTAGLTDAEVEALTAYLETL